MCIRGGGGIEICMISAYWVEVNRMCAREDINNLIFMQTNMCALHPPYLLDRCRAVPRGFLVVALGGRLDELGDERERLRGEGRERSEGGGIGETRLPDDRMNRTCTRMACKPHHPPP